MATLNVGNLGEYLREQRRNAQLSLRQLADAAGVSNPYLSQIERGLRKPSADVLQQVAKALRISAETLYVRAGILDAERDRVEVETRAALLADPTLTERQKQVLLQIYESFRKENGHGNGYESGYESGLENVPGDAGTGGAAATVAVDADGTKGAPGAPDAFRPSEAEAAPDGGTGTGTVNGSRTAGGDAGPRRTAG
ncbi:MULTISPECIES: helix-turn-helix domain-containing protein [Streptomyces]|uniref:Helix-turn-helix domain-containing protein n=1 Tax=Streptomyces griseoaurantiacus TaxID=68213 RepID=A0ABZ1V2N3_9ACTN|nr:MULTISPECIES: helix-turn-helix transcriptional regulator [Streptomyces]MCF0085647.1 putative HTH-type transcriptional regulator [Streptomyces sp. MH192]MCF0098244.1 putative HTH-type transcriptional regulator [Streptomyces sp. MH191]WTI27568.1 helix-turn-helix domain-containing protein [Streptomyces jietaisiensis]